MSVPAGSDDSLITTPFGFHSTARDVIGGMDLTGRRAIITGGASGIGIETARALAGAGASVVLAVRRPDAAAPVAEALRDSTRNPAISVARLDLSDLRSVNAFAVPGAVGWIFSSTTRASWPSRNAKRVLKAMSCSSPPTSSGTSL